MTGDERLQFAIDLAEANLAWMSDADWESLGERAWEFVHPPSTNNPESEVGNVFVETADRDFQFTPEILKRLQPLVKDVLDAVRRRDPEYARENPEPKYVDVTARWRLLSPKPGKDERSYTWHSIQADPPQAFLVVLLHLLERKDTSRIQTCPECGRLFAKVGRMVFCSRRCANKANQQLRRDREQKRKKK